MYLDLHNIQRNGIEQLDGEIFWSFKNDRRSRRDELLKISSISFIANLIEYNINGKPYIKAGQSFSISHSQGCSALVVSNTYSSIGIDIEVNRDFKYWKRVAKRYFTKIEREYCINTNCLERFWEIWVKKEAIVKCLGGSILENAFEVDAFNYCGLNGNRKMEVIYSKLTKCGKDIHISIAYCK